MTAAITKTGLRAKLTRAVNSARDLKNYGLKPQYYWRPEVMANAAKTLREAADAIDLYLRDEN